MSYTNGTPFLNLPQTIGSDHRDWFDTNESFLDLDTKVKSLWDNSGSAASAIDALQELTASLQTDLTALEGTVNTHTSALSTINEALVLINSTLTTLNTSVATKFDSAGIADPYDADHGVYSVGAVVTYNGQRYECITAVTAAEPFDADKWTAVDIQTEINAIKSSISTAKILHTAAGSQTYAEQLAEIKPFYASLSAYQKAKCCIEVNGNIYDIMGLNNGDFVCIFTTASIAAIDLVSLVNEKYYSSEISTASYSRSDLSGNTSSNPMTLLLR